LLQVFWTVLGSCAIAPPADRASKGNRSPDGGTSQLDSHCFGAIRSKSSGLPLPILNTGENRIESDNLDPVFLKTAARPVKLASQKKLLLTVAPFETFLPVSVWSWTLETLAGRSYTSLRTGIS
jgi:hypothetical protein